MDISSIWKIIRKDRGDVFCQIFSLKVATTSCYSNLLQALLQRCIRSRRPTEWATIPLRIIVEKLDRKVGRKAGEPRRENIEVYFRGQSKFVGSRATPRKSTVAGSRSFRAAWQLKLTRGTISAPHGSNPCLETWRYYSRTDDRSSEWKFSAR